MSAPRTLFDRLWEDHRILTNEEGLDLLHVDRDLMTDLSGTVGFEEMEEGGRRIRNPSLHAAVADHVIATGDEASKRSRMLQGRFVEPLERLARLGGVRHFARGSGGQGIVHVMGLEQGLTLPGLTVVCGDSHTSTHGAVGALAWGIGSTEVRHVLATQTLWMQQPKSARVVLSGAPPDGTYAKDVVLWLIGRLGADWGREHAVEFAGPYVEALSVEARATVCNLAVEMGARFGLCAPDEKTFEYLKGRPLAPTGETWRLGVEAWRRLRTDDGSVFDKEVSLDVSTVSPQVTWGVSPEHVVPIRKGAVPAEGADEDARGYMGLSEGQAMDGLPIDYVFIGSCANSRIEDLRVAASVVRGRTVAPHVTAWVVPGSEGVARQAATEGLDVIFREAGFAWRLPGCSMCNAANGDAVPSGKRVVSTSNRNFIGRQGDGARTHLASPATAAACALAGAITVAEPRAA